MDGVERIMVLGIFAVIVSILGVAAWSVSLDDESDPARAADGGALAGPATGLRTPVARPRTRPGATPRQAQLEDRKAQLEAFLGREHGVAKDTSSDRDQTFKKHGSSGAVIPPPPTGFDPRGGSGQARETGSPALRSSPAHDLTAVGPRERSPGSGGANSIKLQRAEPQPSAARQQGRKRYTVVEGDTVWSIARREVGAHNVKASVSEIERLNPDLDLDHIAVDMTLVLPVAAPVGGEERQANTPQPNQASRARAEDGFRLYTVQVGDTLSSIAARELGSASRYLELYQLNKRYLTSPDQVSVGQTIKLPLQ